MSGGKRAVRDTVRLSWFMGVMQAWFNRPDKLSVIRQHRENGRKIERWVLVEMGAALEELHASAPDACGFGCHELDLEKCSFFISQGMRSLDFRSGSCECLFRRKPGHR